MKKKMTKRPVELWPEGIPLLPKVSTLINNCKSQRLEYRILVEKKDDQKDQDKNYTRMNIVVDKFGNLIKWFYG